MACATVPFVWFRMITGVTKPFAHNPAVSSLCSLHFHKHSALQQSYLCTPAKYLNLPRRLVDTKLRKKLLQTLQSERDMAMTFGRKVTPIMIQKKLKNEGILATYMNCVHALNRLKLEIFGSDLEQYSLTPSYMAELKIRGHGVKLEMVNDEFMRLSLTFREGL